MKEPGSSNTIDEAFFTRLYSFLNERRPPREGLSNPSVGTNLLANRTLLIDASVQFTAELLHSQHRGCIPSRMDVRAMFPAHYPKESIPDPPMNDCAICLDPILPPRLEDGKGIATAKLACSHEYHLSCIGTYFNSIHEMKCPTCRHSHIAQPGEGWGFSTARPRPTTPDPPGLAFEDHPENEIELSDRMREAFARHARPRPSLSAADRETTSMSRLSGIIQHTNRRLVEMRRVREAQRRIRPEPRVPALEPMFRHVDANGELPSGVTARSDPHASSLDSPLFLSDETPVSTTAPSPGGSAEGNNLIISSQLSEQRARQGSVHHPTDSTSRRSPYGFRGRIFWRELGHSDHHALLGASSVLGRSLEEASDLDHDQVHAPIGAHFTGISRGTDEDEGDEGSEEDEEGVDEEYVEEEDDDYREDEEEEEEDPEGYDEEDPEYDERSEVAALREEFAQWGREHRERPSEEGDGMDDSDEDPLFLGEHSDYLDELYPEDEHPELYPITSALEYLNQLLPPSSRVYGRGATDSSGSEEVSLSRRDFRELSDAYIEGLWGHQRGDDPEDYDGDSSEEYVQ